MRRSWPGQRLLEIDDVIDRNCSHCRTGLVCRRWYRISRDERLWTAVNVRNVTDAGKLALLFEVCE